MTVDERAKEATRRWVSEGGINLRIEHFIAEAIREAEADLKARCRLAAVAGEWIVYSEDFYQTFDTEASINSLAAALEAC